MCWLPPRNGIGTWLRPARKWRWDEVERGPIAGPGPTWLDLVNKPSVIVNGKNVELRDLPKRPLNVFATLTMSIVKPNEVPGLEIE
jgi:hypothetical protein